MFTARATTNPALTRAVTLHAHNDLRRLRHRNPPGTKGAQRTPSGQRGPPRRRNALPPEHRVTASQGEIECGDQQSVTRDLGQ